MDDRKPIFDVRNNSPEATVSDDPNQRQRPRDATEANNAYVKMPIEVILDIRLGAEALALLLYRATQIGGWSLQRRHINRVFKVGDTVFDRSIKQLQDAQYITRSRARDGTPSQGRMIETLRLPAIKAGYVFLKRSDIESLPLKSVAALAFMGARPHGQHVYIRELCARFSWQPMTARKWLRELISRDFVHSMVRRKDGRLNGVTYTVLGNRSAREGTQRHDAPRDVFQDDGFQDDGAQDGGKAAPYKDRSSTLHFPLTDVPSPTSACASVPADEAGADGGGRRPTQGYSGLLDWAEQDQPEYGSRGQAWIDTLQEVSETIKGVTHDEHYLKDRLIEASGGRIKQSLISPQGIADFNLLVHTLAELLECAPREALGVLLADIVRSIGAKPLEHLNSWHYLIIQNMGNA